jgi:hypothetical protein
MEKFHPATPAAAWKCRHNTYCIKVRYLEIATTKRV